MRSFTKLGSTLDSTIENLTVKGLLNARAVPMKYYRYHMDTVRACMDKHSNTSLPFETSGKKYENWDDWKKQNVNESFDNAYKTLFRSLIFAGGASSILWALSGDGYKETEEIIAGGVGGTICGAVVGAIHPFLIPVALIGVPTYFTVDYLAKRKNALRLKKR